MTDGELAAIGILVLLWLRSREAKAVSSADWGDGWHWPVPEDEQGNRPVISNEFKSPGHMGVDVMYRINGKFVAPEGTHVNAARAGVVYSTGKTARGWNVVIDHGPPWATFYQHLAEEPLVKKGDQVEAGQQIGVMGFDPTDPQKVRHLHFATWYKGAGDGSSVDPGAMMATWLIDTA